MKTLLPALLTILLGACSLAEEPVAQPASPPFVPDFSALTAHDYQVDDSFSLHYMEAGTPGKPIVVFIHGTPGSWRSLGGLMYSEQLQAAAHLISIDRPGWGNSPLPDRRSEPDFDAQAALIEPLLFALRERYAQPLILVGHSWGGTLAPYIAWRQPGLVNALLLAASDIDPRHGRPRWFNHAASLWPVSRFISPELRIANDEMYGVKKAVRALETWWSTTTLPIIYVQGTRDELVDPGNLAFALQHFPGDTGRVITLANQGHFLHRQRQPLLADLTLTLIRAVENDLQLGEMNTCETSLPVC